MRVDSKSTSVLKQVLDEINKNGYACTQLLDLRETHLPFIFNIEYNRNSKSIRNVIEMVNESDALLLATPDYHGSMASSLKNFLEYFWAEFAGKLFGYICSSHEKGLTATDQMRTAIRQCYGWSMPYNISIDEGNDFDINGQLVNPLIVKRVKMLARDIVVYGTYLRNQFNDDIINNTSEFTFAAQYRKSQQT